MLYGVSTADPESFFLVALSVVTVAALASVLPAVRAAQVEPMQVLRDE
jgi:ABC-type lipoprotein release transport system permease subunit